MTKSEKRLLKDLLVQFLNSKRGTSMSYWLPLHVHVEAVIKEVK
ncbi:hypothetical protein [Rhizobium sp. 2MFCol3.1]|nr:hypothetical protein [Rhizobium sp. 2MFCol3.1]